MRWRERLFVAIGVILLFGLSAGSASAGQPKKTGPEWTPPPVPEAVVVKFREGTGVRLQGEELRAGGSRAMPAVNSVLAKYPGAKIVRVFSSSEEDLSKQKAKGEAQSGRRLKDLTLYYHVILREGQDPAALAGELKALDEVETAYVAPRPAPPPIADNLEPEQGHLADPPDAIGMRTVWQLPGGRGFGVTVADSEYSWNTSHEDLSKVRPSAIVMPPAPLGTHWIIPDSIQNDDANTQHGTAVGGELTADNNGFGVTGMISDVGLWLSPTIIAGVLELDGTVLPALPRNIADSIMRLIPPVGPMSAGDVILLEAQMPGAHGGCGASQVGCAPVEYADAEFAAIQVATALGITIVEAAGNGSENLDGPDYAGLFDRNVRDSGAIIVGAGYPPGYGAANPARSKIDFSTYGSRVDVQGWGTGIVTTGYGTHAKSVAGDKNQWYANSFGGTSGASPIVTAAVAAIQANRRATGQPVLWPWEVRDLLRSTGTPQVDSAAFPVASSPIGPLPNLLQAIQTDIAVAKLDAPDPVVAGSDLYYAVTVTNNGPNPGLQVVAVDTLPTDVTFVTDTEGRCVEGPVGTLTCSFGDLAVGASASTLVKVVVHSGAVAGSGGLKVIRNTLTVSSVLADSNTSNNTAVADTYVVDSADLRVTKVCKPDGKLLAGQTGFCSILVDNLGPSDSRNVQVSDLNLSNGVFTIGAVTTSQGSCSVVDNLVSCDLGTLAAATTSVAGRATVTIPVSASEAMDINDVATAVAATPDPVPANDEARGSISVEALADLAIAGWASSATVAAGEAITYTLRVQNLGPSTATNVLIRDALPSAVTVQSIAGPGGTCNAGTPGDPLLPATCAFDSVGAGVTKTMTLQVLVSPAMLGVLTNDARASSETRDDNNANDLLQLTTNVNARADLAVTKLDHPDPVFAGNSLTYEITVVNLGPSLARAVTLTDALPNGVTFTRSIFGTNGGTCALETGTPNNVSCELGDLPPGAHVLLYLETQVSPSLPAGAIVNTAVTASEATDSVPANNTAAQTTTVATQADLAVQKTSDADLYKSSATIEYTIRTRNAGPSDAQAVVVTDTLPPSSLGYHVFDTGGCSLSGTTLTCPLNTVLAGDVREFKIYYRVQGKKGSVTNTAAVSSATTDPKLSDNQAVRTVLVQGKDTPRK